MFQNDVSREAFCFFKPLGSDLRLYGFSRVEEQLNGEIVDWLNGKDELTTEN